MNLAVVGKVGNGKQPQFTCLCPNEGADSRGSQEAKDKGVTIVSHRFYKSFVFEPVFFLILFQKIA